MTHFQPKDFRNNRKTTWCKGCTFHSVLNALTDVFAKKETPPKEITVVAGIGCSSRLPFFLTTKTVHALHGRALPVAIGCKLAHPERPVVVVGGDGDLFSIGTGHFVQAARRNIPMLVLCLDNQMFAMTKNQVSPTSPQGHCGTLSPVPEPSLPLNLAEFAIACNASFVARTFTGAPEHCKNVLDQALHHNGFAFVHIIAPCRTFSRTSPLLLNSVAIVDVNQTGGHDVTDRAAALSLAGKLPDRMAEGVVSIGILRDEPQPTFNGPMAQEHVDNKHLVSLIIDHFSVD